MAFKGKPSLEKLTLESSRFTLRCSGNL